MRREWVGKNIKLSLLSECVGDFLRQRGFKTRKKEAEQAYEVSGALERERVSHRIVIQIRGNSDDFVLEFASGDQTRLFQMLGPLATLFGGGSLVLKSVKSQEFSEKLEEEFWLFAEETITRLASPASEKQI